jgi:hypothetical protein
MYAKEYRTVDKSDWGPGPWQDEPDKRQWLDENTGYPCLIVRNALGALCGYVGVPAGHPAYGHPYDEYDGDGPCLGNLAIHGGLTFSGFCAQGPKESSICHEVEPGEDDHVNWFGFDCNHAGDLAPKTFKQPLEDWELKLFHGQVYRDFDYVTAEVTRLAEQLAAMEA